MTGPKNPSQRWLQALELEITVEKVSEDNLR